MTAPPESPGRRGATSGEVGAARFSARRLTSALVRRDPAPVADPLRAHGRATIAGALLAVLGLAAAAVVGAVSRPADWRSSAIVVGERSGALAVVTRADPPALVGVPNLASARLAAAAVAGAPVPVDPVEIDDDVLAAAPRARPVGIVDAPVLPPADLPGPALWSVCDTTEPVADRARPRTTTRVLGGSRPPGRPLAPGEGLVVVDRAGQNWLVLGGTRARLDVTRPAVVEALGLGGLLPRPASSGFLAALPEAPPITPPAIPRRGAPVPADLAGERTGGVVRLVGAGSADTYLLVLSDGVEVVPELLARLIRLDDPALAGVPIPTVSPAQVANTPISRAIDVGAYPDPAPVPLPPDRAPTACADRGSDGGGAVTAAAGVTVAADPLPPGVALRQADGSGDRADRAVLPGTGVAVQEEDGALVVVAATGSVHGVPDAAVAEALGLGRRFTPAPRAVIGLLPTGAPLSVEAATRPLG